MTRQLLLPVPDYLFCGILNYDMPLEDIGYLFNPCTVPSVLHVYFSSSFSLHSAAQTHSITLLINLILLPAVPFTLFYLHCEVFSRRLTLRTTAD
jgi:hypothetical protein